MHALRDTVPWRDGWLIHPEPSNVARGSGGQPGFRLLAVPGEFTAHTATPGWRLVIRWKEEIEEMQAGCLASGFALVAGDATVVACCTAPGTWSGTMPPTCSAELVADDTPVQGTGPQTWIERPGESVALLQEPAGERVRWALVWTRTDGHQSLVMARAALAIDPVKAWEDLRARRQALLDRIDPTPAHRARVIEAIEWILGALRPADNVFAGRWLDTEDDPPGMHIGRTLTVVPALALLDRGAAVSVFETVLGSLAEVGSLHALVSHHSAAEVAATPLPIAAQTALALWRMQPDLSFLQRAVPHLLVLLKRELEHFTDDTGLAYARSAAESLLPDLFAADVATPDIAALLVAEIDALTELSVSLPDRAEEVRPLAARRTQLLAAMRSAFWHPDSQSIRGRLADGRPLRRATAADAMPLLCAGLDAELAASALKLIGPAGALHAPAGLLDWERWATDDETPPSSPHIQMLLLDGLRENGHTEAADALAQRLTGWTFPHTIEGDRAPLEHAALVLRLHGLGRARPATRTLSASFLEVLDRHRVAAASTVAALGIGLYALLVVPAYLRPDPAESLLAVQLGSAEMRYAERDFRSALAQFERLLPTPLRDEHALDCRMGNCWFHLADWPRAEAAYREAIARNPDQPKAWMNLALTLFRQQKYTEAAGRYRAFIGIFGSLYPELKARAETALALCEEQSARSAP